jgi:hypothetical protein
MSRDGQFITGQTAFTDGHSQMFRWSKTYGSEVLGNSIGDTGGRSFAISNDGNTVVGSTGEDEGPLFYPTFALIWRAEWGVRRVQELLTNDYGLDLTGWQLISGRALSVDGTVLVGNGINPAGNTEAWIATIPPPLPKIGILCDGVNCILSWPTNSVGFVLQSCKDPALNSWTSLTNLPSVVADQFVMTNAISSSAAYFRLAK